MGVSSTKWGSAFKKNRIWITCTCTYKRNNFSVQSTCNTSSLNDHYSTIFKVSHQNCVSNKILVHVHVHGENYPMIALWCHHSLIMTDFLMPATQQHIIIIILVVYSFYFLTFLENYIDNIDRNKFQQE